MAEKIYRRPQFSLALLMGAVVTCAVIFGLIFNMETTYHIEIRCATIPVDDESLIQWFRDQPGVRDVTVTRPANNVVCKITKRHGSFKLFAPPLAELGYTGLESMKSTISKSSLVGGAFNWISSVPVFIWFAVAAVLIGLLARRIIHGWKLDRSTKAVHLKTDGEA